MISQVFTFKGPWKYTVQLYRQGRMTSIFPILEDKLNLSVFEYYKFKSNHDLFLFCASLILIL